ncbi:MAG: FG-GAP repeat protein [Planctomycetota bacterium]
MRTLMRHYLFWRLAVVVALVFTGALVPTRASAQCEHKLTAYDATWWEEFGHSVALCDRAALVGKPMHRCFGVAGSRGAVYAYRCNGVAWLIQQKPMASDGWDDDFFGTAVGLDEGVAIVGAAYRGSVRGAAYVFRDTGGRWQEEQKLTVASDDQSFGCSVAVAGDVAVVGSEEDADTGAAYVFRYDGVRWNEEQRLVASNAMSGDCFGLSVAIWGDRILVGAPQTHSRTVGYAAVYRFNGVTWQQEQQLIAVSGSANDYFGCSVSLRQDLALIGSYGNNSAYVFRHDGSKWTQESWLMGTGSFGYSVSLESELALIGAPSQSEGRAHVYRYDGSAWVPYAELRASDGVENDGLGLAVSLDGSRALVGAPRDEDAGTMSGSAYVFHDASWRNYGDGWSGTNGIPPFTASAAPLPGTVIDLEVGNSLGATTTGVLLAGLIAWRHETALGGTLLVLPDVIVNVVIPGAGLTFPATILPELGGFTVHLQCLELDPGASRGVSFTPRLTLEMCAF